MDLNKSVTMRDLLGTGMILVGGYLLYKSVKGLIDNHNFNKKIEKKA